MRYAQIVPFEVCNGKGAGVSLFTQGCRFHCKGCFNQDAWDFDGGKEWTDEIEDKFFELISRPYVKRVSILGGEPLANENVRKIYLLTKKIKSSFPDKKIWIYSGFTYDEIMNKDFLTYVNSTQADDYRQFILEENADVFVDGRYNEKLKDITLAFRGSSNQNIWKKENGVWVKTT